MPVVGVVGVGTMGMLAVQLLLKKGQAVVVSDVNPSALERVRALGAQPVDGLAQVAKQADMVLLFVPGPAQVEAVVAGDGGLLSAGQTGQTIVDLSTIDPQTTRRLGRQAIGGSLRAHRHGGP